MVDEKHVEKQWSSCDHRGSLLSVGPLLHALPPEHDTEPFPGLPALLQQHLNIQIRPINVSVKNHLNDQGQFTQGFLLEPSHPQNPGGLSKRFFWKQFWLQPLRRTLFTHPKVFKHRSDRRWRLVDPSSSSLIAQQYASSHWSRKSSEGHNFPLGVWTSLWNNCSHFVHIWCMYLVEWHAPLWVMAALEWFSSSSSGR